MSPLLPNLFIFTCIFALLAIPLAADYIAARLLQRNLAAINRTSQICRRSNSTYILGTSHREAIIKTLRNHRILFLGDSTLHNKALYLWQESEEFRNNRNYAELGKGLSIKCYHVALYQFELCYKGFIISHNQNPDEIIHTLNKTMTVAPQFDMIVLNFGLHGLHLYPERRTLPVLQFEPVISSTLSWLSLRFPSAKLYYKLTNAICSEKFDGVYASALERWHNGTNTGARTACAQDVDQLLHNPPVGLETYFFKNVRGGQSIRHVAIRLCDLYIFDNIGVQAYNLQARRIVSQFSNVAILDTYSQTHDGCNFTGAGDGRHYAELIPAWWDSLLCI
jgi:hypothetical protein